MTIAEERLVRKRWVQLGGSHDDCPSGWLSLEGRYTQQENEAERNIDTDCVREKGLFTNSSTFLFVDWCREKG